MSFLHLLESIRTPSGDKLAAIITMLGDETVFMLVGMIILWCFNKKWGFRFMFIGLTGTTLTQLLKAIFLVPRPWVIDPSFTIVEAARAGAMDYSFPSGHTQSAATVFGTLAVWLKKPWVTICCAVLILLAGFSRMYLGVHTPLDVSVGLAAGLITVFGMVCAFEQAEKSPRGKRLLGGSVLLFALALLGYVLLRPVSAANIPEFDASGVKNAWTLLGTICGLLLCWWLDETRLHFRTKAVWWAQLCKVAIGLVLMVGARMALKPVLAALFGNAGFTHAVRYFVMALIGGWFWPMTFGFWGRLRQKDATKTVSAE